MMYACVGYYKSPIKLRVNGSSPRRKDARSIIISLAAVESSRLKIRDHARTPPPSK